ncbi:ADP-ribosylation factor GTPase-activating protein 2 isoform X2 [Tribolium castaneum]|uniref:ADP-ribosylation factor GTPase-activating protein 2 isoform X2 n=1 Tax=Tribolium castaneum TaxID=7070 RepID=UPI00077DADDF|nr:PREDICTED: ADP-ribosylation factor GTPase-activating protein 2 isoform X2 [Tribolium castaneum]|eukprot:XP_015834728.1 PREDICTED: ADP-ribosylation factor GTPase-activating protein 2 isoform X2 [Tribolium castaneum]
MDPQPSKSDIEAVFHRLRANPANKVCFDCNAKNPTWASVTYGVFICIDCSAVHRSLGVHLTFVRSTQLDTNWTWVQLRQMQLGGNSNAIQFFSQHNCMTTDAQKKYNSRAAQLYKDKLHQAALNSLKSNTQIEESQSLQKDNKNPDEGPNVDFSAPAANPEPRKSTIATRKPPNKKSGLGAKKGGLGATKVKTNFAEIEREAEIAEESRLRALEESAKAAALSLKEQEEREAAVRLAYKDLSNEQMKKEEQLRRQDPKKAEQVERLGMGVNARSGVSHSALSDMTEIEQENVQPTPSTLSSLGKLRISDSDSFFDEYSFSSGFNINRANKMDMFGLESSRERDKEKDNWVIVEDPVEKPKPTYRTPEKVTKSFDLSSDAAQKKFGNAKAISSDQFFNDREPDYETKANLNRFQGSSSISSAEFFGNGKEATPSSHMQAYDLDDVKESVRQGVTRIAGKFSYLANEVMSSLQDRYGN